MKEIASIYIWQNGMVMTFDQYGEQMPEYQGRIEQVLDKIKRDAPSSVHWYGGNWPAKETWPIERPNEETR